MARIVIQVPMSSELKEKAELVSSSLGFSSLQEIIRVLLTKLSKKELNLKIEENVEEISHLSKAAEKRYKKALEDIKSGRVSPSFETAEDAIAWLNDPGARLQNGDKV